MLSEYHFTIELSPPSDPKKIPDYFKRFERLLKFTNSVGISSHPTSDQISGFDKSYNLAKYLRSQVPEVDILFHVTCLDLNQVNIFARLTLLRELKIKKILVITGEDYSRPNKCPEFHYENSNSLIYEILLNYKLLFESVGIAAYPGGNPKHLTKNDKEECERILYTKMSLIPGIATIYTQCISGAAQFRLFSETMKNSTNQTQCLNIVPSIGIFNDPTSFDRVSRLTRVKMDNELLKELNKLELIDYKLHLKHYFIDLCKELKTSSQKKVPINICTFGLFEFVEEIIEELVKKDTKHNEYNKT